MRNATQIERCRQRLTVESCGQALDITPGQFTRLCREVLDLSTLGAINARVTHQAQRERVCSTFSIKQLAAELGYADDAYFGRCFKKQPDLRPTEFREMARRPPAEG